MITIEKENKVIIDLKEISYPIAKKFTILINKENQIKVQNFLFDLGFFNNTGGRSEIDFFVKKEYEDKKSIPLGLFSPDKWHDYYYQLLEKIEGGKYHIAEDFINKIKSSL